jgi:hypothetical protein
MEGMLAAMQGPHLKKTRHAAKWLQAPKEAGMAVGKKCVRLRQNAANALRPLTIESVPQRKTLFREWRSTLGERSIGGGSRRSQ